MSQISHSRRFYLQWLAQAIETEVEETSEAPDVAHISTDGEATINMAERDFEEALEQISSERLCVCPLCGAIVAPDGSVLG